MTAPCSFDTPLRLHWEVPAGGDLAVAKALREAGPLALAAEAERASDLDCLGLPWPGVSVAWVWTGWRCHFGREPLDLPSGVFRVELPVEGPSEAAAAAERFPPSSFPREASPAYRFLPRPLALPALPSLLALAAVNGWGVTIPSLPAGEAEALPGPGGPEFPPGEMEKAAAGFPAGGLVVHDFFLTRALGIPLLEAAGCEAADALAFIDAKGRVFPCRSLLLPLGSLPRDSLSSLWSGPLRRKLRERISRTPPACESCGELARCKGGCRGLAWHAHGGFHRPDPSCPRPSTGPGPEGGGCPRPEGER